MKRLLLFGLALLVLAGALFAATRGATDAAAAGSTARVVREDFRETVEATGRLEAAVAYEVGPPSVEGVWDYALAWMIPEGRRVKAGDVVARFDATNVEDQLRTHRAQLETTLQEREKEERNLQVSLERLALDLVVAEGDLAKLGVTVALPEGMVSGIEMEELKLSRDLAEHRVKFLREKIAFERELVKGKLDVLDVKRRFVQSKLDYNQAARDKFDVKAPVPGLVVNVPKRNGERWEVGESVWMMAKILKVADITTLRVEADVLEVDSARLAAGQPAVVTVDALPGLRFETTVEDIGRIVHERSNQDRTKVFDVVLPLGQEAPDALRPGMSVRVEVETARHPGVLTIPVAAVRVTDDGPCVLVQGEDGQQQLAPVQLGARAAGRVVVVEGVAEGALLVLPKAARKAGQA